MLRVCSETRHTRSTTCAEHERLHFVHASTLRHRIPTDSREITRWGLLSQPRSQIDGALYSICRRISSFSIIAPKNYLQDRCHRHKMDVLWIFARCKWVLGVAEHGRRPEALHERCCYRHSIATSLRTEVDFRFPAALHRPSAIIMFLFSPTIDRYLLATANDRFSCSLRKQSILEQHALVQPPVYGGLASAGHPRAPEQ